MSLKANSPVSLFAPEIHNNSIPNKNKKDKKIHNCPTMHDVLGTPIYASFLKASYTIEAAIVMPLFITLMVFGIFIFRILQVQSGIQQSLDIASRTMAVTLGDHSQDEELSWDDVLLIGGTIAYANEQILVNEVPLEYIDGGIIGLNYLGSSAQGNYIDLQVKYNMTFPVGLLGKHTFSVSQRSKNRKWVGYDPAEDEWDGEYVYITEHGSVYHTDINCTYLYPSVSMVSVDEVGDKRNKSGGKYYKCSRCKNVANNGYVYITDYGTAYHNSVACTEIKHNVSKVLYEDVKDTMAGCSKCAAGIHEE